MIALDTTPALSNAELTWSRRRLLSALGLILVSQCLSGCAAPKRVSTTSAIHTPLPREADTFERSGRFALRWTDRVVDKTENLQGGFRWIETPQQLDLTLLSPVGTALARLSVEPGRAELQRNDAEPETAIDADALTERLFGWQLPVVGLRRWMRGLGPNGKVVGQDDQSFTEAEWQVRLSAFDALGPTRLEAHRDTPTHHIDCRLVCLPPA